ncbi:CRISPR-associated protein Csx10 [Actinopolyspora alba]|uniref:CRISPR-associated protein Csx10 n=1 Tax=Actinopolyspora alba TaxID=673379 RepID=A0A1I1Z783_9ACTN|nr:type III-B CRISPR module-associated Cmr3 family protein [Actinopolyspora alba]SFE27412.1 CRISPR-associated protein Csx10 [Actinopolyspora alba]
MTQHALVTVRLEEPMVAGKNPRADSRQDSHNHVPGSVLRGALAAVWLREHGTEANTSPEFERVFEGEGSFGPLHYASSKPVPLSMLTHKYEPANTCKQLWWDQARGEKASHCPNDRCGSQLEESKGQPYGKVPSVDRTMVALSTDGVALDGSLYSQRAVQDGLLLRGWVYGDAVRALYPEGTAIESLLLGSRRSLRGEATVEVDTEAVPEPVELYGEEVVLRLAAPGAFVDEFGMPSATPDPDELSEQLGVSEVEIIDSWSRWEEAGGWHAASGLPKPVERVVSAGSTYRVRCAEPPTETARRRLMTRGIGLRRREGFGALYRCEPPWGISSFTGHAAALRAHPELVSRFQARLEEIRLDNADDSQFDDALRSTEYDDRIHQAIQAVLTVKDAEIYEQILRYMEQNR